MQLKFSRLFQPRNPLFWLMIVLQALSTAIIALLQTREPGSGLTIVLVAFALANALLGMGIALRLMSGARAGSD